MERLKGTSEKQLCRDCGSEYEANYVGILSQRYDLSQGRCSECRAKLRAKASREEEVQLKMQIAKRRKDWRAECGIPLKFMNEDFGTFDTQRPGNIKQVHKVCLEYAEKFPIEYSAYIKREGKAYPSLLLFSEIAGLGKSHLAASICHHILNRWQGESITNPIMFITESELLGQIQETYSYGFEEKQLRESEEDIIKRAIYKPLLVLDEVGYERRTDLKFVRRILFRVINGHYNNLRPIILTTNLQPKQLKNYLDRVDKVWDKKNTHEVERTYDEAERTFDRLCEMTGGQFFEIEGESYRRRERR